MVERDPYLMSVLKERSAEIIAHGWNMDHLHYGGMESGQELEQIQNTKLILEKCFDQDIQGWLSPVKSQSPENSCFAGSKWVFLYDGLGQRRAAL